MARDQEKSMSIARSEHDRNEYRKRVATYVDGSSVSYEDASFVTGDSPLVVDIATDLGRVGHAGEVINDGSGNILVEISADGSVYGGQHTLKWGDVLDLDNLKVSKIRLTWQQNSSYRIFVA